MRTVRAENVFVRADGHILRFNSNGWASVSAREVDIDALNLLTAGKGTRSLREHVTYAMASFFGVDWVFKE